MAKTPTLLLALVLVAGRALGAGPDPSLFDARALAMGGALRSLAETSAAARLNPAGLSPRRGFFGAVSYATSSAGPVDAVQLTLVDNVTSPFGGAIQYLRLQCDVEREDASLSLSGGKQGLWWGATGRYVHARSRGGAEWDDAVTADLGFLFERPQGIRIAVVGYDLLDTTSLFLKRRVALGLSYAGLVPWTFAADLVRDLDRDFAQGLDLHLGVEYQRSDTPWTVRAGQMWRGDTGKDYASVGFGWSTRSFQLAYALQKARQRSGELLHVLSAEASF